MAVTQTIVPNLWFDSNAGEAAEFYTSVFADGVINNRMNYPSSSKEGLADFQQDLAGKLLTVDFSLGGVRFIGINAGPEFRPTPATSFFVNFDPSRMDNPREQLDALWEKLMGGGKALMPLQEYPFSKHYGWVEDKYGFSWQLMLTNPDGEPRPYIVPSLMFTDVSGYRGEEALRYYTEVFKDSRLGNIVTYPDTGRLMFGDAELRGQWFAAMDGVGEQGFTFTEAVSYAVTCQDQAEIDYYWEKLSAHPESEQCGWCKDKFGVSWQIVPENMNELMQKLGAYETMMNQHKIVIEEYDKE